MAWRMGNQEGLAVKVLVANWRLGGLTGSERNAYTICQVLKARGHVVTAFGRELCGEAMEYCRLGVGVLHGAPALEGCSFDLVHVSQNVVALEVAQVLHDVPMVYQSHSPLTDLERIEGLDVGADVYCGISSEVCDRLRLDGAPGSRVVLFRNIVDDQLFSCGPRWDKRLARAVVVSDRMPESAINAVVSACGAAGVRMEFYGERWGKFPPAHVAQAMRNSRYCFAMGRGAVEGLLSGCAVIVADVFGMGGLVSPENYGYLRRSNFTGRGLGLPVSSERIREAMDRYDFRWSELLCKVAAEEFGCRRQGERLEDLYGRASRARGPGE